MTRDQPMTYDQIAARYILAGQPIPAALVREARASIGYQCPDCDSTDTESNGGTEYRCRVCDHRWGTDCGERYGY